MAAKDACSARRVPLIAAAVQAVAGHRQLAGAHVVDAEIRDRDLVRDEVAKDFAMATHQVNGARVVPGEAADGEPLLDLLGRGAGGQLDREGQHQAWLLGEGADP